MRQAPVDGQKNRMHRTFQRRIKYYLTGDCIQSPRRHQDPHNLPLSADCFAIACRAMDALGNPLGFFLTGGQACDLDGADHLICDLESQILLADKGYDADARVIEPLVRVGKQVVIPPKSNRKVQRSYDKSLYKARHLIENFFEKLKHYRAIATRYDKIG